MPNPVTTRAGRRAGGASREGPGGRSPPGKTYDWLLSSLLRRTPNCFDLADVLRHSRDRLGLVLASCSWGLPAQSVFFTV
eukprot:12616908-Alexandrium_andersonii.AAC.1